MLDLSNSILLTTKKRIGLAPEYCAFDPDIIMAINTAFAELTQMGIGPTEGFTIEDENDSWFDFVDSPTEASLVSTYVYMITKKIFDPPTSSSVKEAMEQTIDETRWRIYITRNFNEKE